MSEIQIVPLSEILAFISDDPKRPTDRALWPAYRREQLAKIAACRGFRRDRSAPFSDDCADCGVSVCDHRFMSPEEVRSLELGAIALVHEKNAEGRSYPNVPCNCGCQLRVDLHAENCLVRLVSNLAGYAFRASSICDSHEALRDLWLAALLEVAELKAKLNATGDRP